MSLINKMLQDLDARGSGGASAVQQDEVKAVPPRERDRRPVLLGGAVAGALVLAAGGWYGWQYWQAHKAPPPPPVMKAIDTRVPDRPRFQEPPAAARQPQPAQAPSGSEAAAGTGQAASDAHAASSAAATPVPSARSAPMDDADAVATKPGRAKHEVQVDDGGSAVVAKPKRGAAADSAQSRKAARTATAEASTSEGVMLRELTPKQTSENSYRRALAALQEGRVSAALADLDKAVEIDPRNDAARQTYVSLLLENRRTDDAIRQLRLALGIDPRQPGLAMVLARLQLEKGGPALDTLMKTLPYAGDSPDYHAFLAGVLQREQRHAEAAEHYRQALQMSPQNAVWWMGLGISLQADQHLPEAREAYNRARGNPGLTPELRSFIERKLEQLSR